MASPVALSILHRRCSGPALARLLFLLVAAAVFPPAAVADLTSAPSPAYSTLPGPADSPPSPPGSTPSPAPAPAPQSGSDSPLPPHFPPLSPPYQSPNAYPEPADALPVPTAGSASEKLRSNPEEPEQDSSDDGGMSAGKKAGVAVGVLFAAVLAVAAFVVYRKRRDNIRRASRYAGFTNRSEMQMQMV